MHLGFPSRISGSELALAVGKDGREMLRFEACAPQAPPPDRLRVSELETAAIRAADIVGFSRPYPTQTRTARLRACLATRAPDRSQ